MPSNMIPIYYSKSATDHIYIELEFEMDALWD